MTTTTTASSTSGGSSRQRWSARRGTVVLVVVVVGMLVLVWQWRSPRAFHDQGNVIGMYSQVGTTALLDMGNPRRDLDPPELTIHAVEPQLFSGNATVDVLVCHYGPKSTGLGAGRDRDLTRHCADREPAEGARMTRDDQLLLRVRSDEPGRVVVRGVEVTYSHGWRRGTQLTGQTARVEFGTETVREHQAND